MNAKTLSEFSQQDSENLVQIAQAAPLQNMRAAEQVSQLLVRFQLFAQRAFDQQKAKRATKDSSDGQPSEAA